MVCNIIYQKLQGGVYMQVILMAGGKGTRLWPLSTNEKPKQFVNFLGDKTTMLSSTYKNISKLNYPVYVSTQSKYSDLVLKQTNSEIPIISEPFSNNTFAAFLNIAIYLKYKKGINLNEIIALIPTDHDVEPGFYNILNKAKDLLQKSNKNFCLVGIKPTFPSTQYGYIQYEGHNIIEFSEKPNEEKAIELLAQHAVWNSGILIFKLGAMIEISKNYCTYDSYFEFVKKYDQLPNNSFDYEILEKRKDILMVLSDKSWNDLGNWYSLYSNMSITDEYNTNIINKESKLIKNFGVKDSIIINTSDGLALYPKNINNKAFRNWGYYSVLDYHKINEVNIKIKYLKIFKDKNISYQRHSFRDEVWIIINGFGEVVINGQLRKVQKGDICNVSVMDKHSIKAIETLEIIEIQKGIKTEEKDIERIEYEWEKISGI